MTRADGLTSAVVINRRHEGLSDRIKPQSEVTVKAKKSDGKIVEFKTTVLLNTDVEVNYFRNGGILHTVLRNLVK